MIRGIRGATTVLENEKDSIIDNTKILIQEMAKANHIVAEDIASVLISVTSDIDATFPASALRLIDGWMYVPVMCTKEIEVPGSLEKCIRVMMTANTKIGQKEIIHVYHHEAKKLRPDLTKKKD
ncbi:chorismate mutase [Aquibacillus rhizosphaerae]|uniref:chorismate mutase n=1 Tax=Aquibacillus rhizosphaerae TaxID=3051431 RepID=A0ABT7L884_9BACI|nr:chorismate mutase [Aquibacillus sp. LR5S19]MDL4840805.1 chorismate mutase [Aquibacillus sp. LR5S19]